MGITLDAHDPNVVDRIAARDLAAGDCVQVEQRKPRIHSRPRLGADSIKNFREFPMRCVSALLRDVSRRGDLFPGSPRRGELRINQQRDFKLLHRFIDRSGLQMNLREIEARFRKTRA